MDVGRYPLSITLLQKTDALKTEQQKETNSAYSSYRLLFAGLVLWQSENCERQRAFRRADGNFPQKFCHHDKRVWSYSWPDEVRDCERVQWVQKQLVWSQGIRYQVSEGCVNWYFLNFVWIKWVYPPNMQSQNRYLGAKFEVCGPFWVNHSHP